MHIHIHQTGGRLYLGHLHKKSQISFSALPKHKFLYTISGPGPCRLKINLVRKIRLDGIRVDLCKGRSHYIQRQKQGQTYNCNGRRYGLRGQSTSNKGQNNNYSRKGRHHHQKTWQNRQAGKDDYKFDRC